MESDTRRPTDRIKVFGIAGWSNAGKTTLIERMVPAFTRSGLSVSVVKHAHERFDIDRPGKDSHRFREAGSYEVMISSPARWALMHENRETDEATLDELLSHLSPCDIALVEGFKRDPIPKLEVHRASNGKPMLWPDDPHIVAVASDLPVATGLPQFRLDDIVGITTFVLATVGLASSVVQSSK